MTLYTPANGLFGTHVTWDDVEEDMQRELGTAAIFGPNKAATNIGEAKVSHLQFRQVKDPLKTAFFQGFMSRIVLIEPDWQHKDKTVPEKFIVKVSFPRNSHKIAFCSSDSTVSDSNSTGYATASRHYAEDERG